MRYRKSWVSIQKLHLSRIQRIAFWNPATCSWSLHGSGNCQQDPFPSCSTYTLLKFCEHSQNTFVKNGNPFLKSAPFWQIWTGSVFGKTQRRPRRFGCHLVQDRPWKTRKMLVKLVRLWQIRVASVSQRCDVCSSRTLYEVCEYWAYVCENQKPAFVVWPILTNLYGFRFRKNTVPSQKTRMPGGSGASLKY